MRPLSSWVLLVFALGLFPQRAGAQSDASPPGAPALSESLTGPAKEAYESARVLLNNHDPAGALTKFQQAYDLSKDPRLRFNMAVCARDLRAYARMQKLLLLYEKEAGASLSAQEKADVDAALATIRDLVGTLKLMVNEAGATVVLDGENIGATPLDEPVIVDLGRHTLIVRKPGFDPAEKNVETAGGSEINLAITLSEEQHVGRLAVVTDSAATIIVDKKEVGIGRYEGTLPAGTHEVLVRGPGKKPYESLVDLRSGETRSLQVTLLNESRGLGIWPWVVGGAMVAAGASVGAYFLFRPKDQRGPLPPSTLDNPVQLTLRSDRP
jgi:hypothetical protein